MKAKFPKGTDFNMEHTFYKPKFFDKGEIDGKLKFEFQPKVGIYWEKRERQDWADQPKIFEDDIKPFF